MKRRDWNALAAVFSWMVGALIASLSLIGLLGPKTGAAEGERSLDFGGVWIARVHEQITDLGHHRWWSEVNWWLLLAVIVVAGVAGYVRTATRMELPR